jgi:hypothetical protein
MALFFTLVAGQGVPPHARNIFLIISHEDFRDTSAGRGEPN